jgi:DNA primase
MRTLLDYIPDVQKQGNEYGATCPACGGEDRLRIWVDDETPAGRYWCRQCHERGDAIAWLKKWEGMTFREACEVTGQTHKLDAPRGDSVPPSDRAPVVQPTCDNVTRQNKRTGPRPWRAYEPPGDVWRDAASAFVTDAERRLWSDHPAAPSALRYLRGRGLKDDTIRSARLGLHPSDTWPPRSAWGLSGDGKMWLPRGVVIPWFDAEGVSCVNIRRPNGDVKPDGEPWEARKYQRAAGPSAPLYGAGTVQIGQSPVALVEGEFDALAVRQEAGDLCIPVATGSTGGARRAEWLAMLRAAPAVLVAFDAEDAGSKAAAAWLERLPNGIRWAPHATDAAEMLEAGKDVRLWIRVGIAAARHA